MLQTEGPGDFDLPVERFPGLIEQLVRGGYVQVVLELLRAERPCQPRLYLAGGRDCS